MKVFILSNDDLTSHLIFSELFFIEGVEVVGVGFSSSLVREKSGRFSGALDLLRKMDIRYWLYLVFTNGCFELYKRIWARNSSGSAGIRSLVFLAKQTRTPIYYSSDFNGPAFVETVRNSGASLLVIRVNQILKPELLAIPNQGTWCVHSSLLPSYRGIAAEFHGLKYGENRIGSTIFQVALQLDSGPSLLRCYLDVVPRGSVFKHMIRNNRAAGAILRSAVSNLVAGRGPQPLAVDTELVSSYHSWPKSGQVAELHKKGHKLISIREALSLALLFRIPDISAESKAPIAPTQGTPSPRLRS